MGDTGPFALNEKVLVPHTDKFYEAKVLKAQRREDGLWYYLLHYTGWNKKWDEWVEETGLRRANAAAAAAPPKAADPAFGSFAGAAAPTASIAASSAAAGTAGAIAPSKSKQAKGATAVPRQRRAGEAGAAAETTEPQIELELPAALKKQLLDQYDAIHDDSKIVPLPRRPNVQQILQNYVQYVRDKKDESAAEDDIVMGLQVWFDKALYQCLLFKGERQQAKWALAAGQAPSAVYGAEHLLRLFVKLPELLPETGASDEQLHLLMKRLEDLIAYLQHQAAKIFAPVTDYLPIEAQGAAPMWAQPIKLAAH